MLEWQEGCDGDVVSHLLIFWLTRGDLRVFDVWHTLPIPQSNVGDLSQPLQLWALICFTLGISLGAASRRDQPHLEEPELF